MSASNEATATAVGTGPTVAVRRPLKAFASGLALFSALLAALLTAGTVYLHALGLAYYSAYLSQFGVGPGQFPASVSDLMMCGYFALIERGFWVSTSWMTQPKSWLILAAIYLYVRFIVFLFRMPVSPLVGIPRWLAIAIREVATPLLIVLGLYVVVAVLSTSLWTLVSPGHFAGVRLAEKHIAAAIAKCTRCITVETSSGRLEGLLIAASEGDIAVFVPDQRITHVVSRSKVTSMTSRLRDAPDVEKDQDVSTPKEASPGG